MKSTFDREIQYLTLAKDVNTTEFNDSFDKLIFKCNRTTPIIYNPHLYYLKIVNFTIPTSSYPLFIPSITKHGDDNPTNDINLTKYKFKMSYNYDYQGVQSQLTVTESVIWESQTLQAPPQNAGTITPYYWCYDFNWPIRLMNRTIASLWTQCVNQLLADGAQTFGSEYVPFIAYTQVDSMFRFWFPYMFREKEMPNAGFYAGYNFKLSLNSSLYALFPGVSAKSEQIGNETWFTLQSQEPVITQFVRLPFTSSNQSYMYEMAAEKAALRYWYAAKKLSIESTHLPVVYEQIQFGSDSSPRFANLLQEFEIASQEPLEYLVFENLNNSNHVELIGDNPLVEFTLSVYWINRVGEKQLVFLGPEQTASIKLQFIRKDAATVGGSTEIEPIDPRSSRTFSSHRK